VPATPPPVILAFRGSRDPEAARSAANLVRAVGMLRPDTRVRGAFLDFGAPGLPAALAKEAGLGHRAAVVVPVLLTAGYHARVRIPAEIAAAAATGLPLRVHLAAVLGPTGDRQDDPARSLVVAALLRGVGQAAARGSGRHSVAGWGPDDRRVDGIVLAAAGGPATRALDAVESVASALRVAAGVPCSAGYVVGNRPDVTEAVTAMRGRGAGRVAVAAYLVTRGRCYARAAADAWAAGAVVVADPLADGPELPALALHRVDTTLAERRI
jgi:sirohydrochlorin ferrochelatase